MLSIPLSLLIYIQLHMLRFPLTQQSRTLSAQLSECVQALTLGAITSRLAISWYDSISTVS